MTDKPIRQITTAWLQSSDRWRGLTPVVSAPAGLNPLTPGQRELLATLADLDGSAHLDELAERMEVSEAFVLATARSLRGTLRVSRDEDSTGRPRMITVIPPEVRTVCTVCHGQGTAAAGEHGVGCPACGRVRRGSACK